MFQVKRSTVVVLLITIFVDACGDIVGDNSIDDWIAQWIWSSTDELIQIVEFKRNGTYS